MCLLISPTICILTTVFTGMLHSCELKKPPGGCIYVWDWHATCMVWTAVLLAFGRALKSLQNATICIQVHCIPQGPLQKGAG